MRKFILEMNAAVLIWGVGVWYISRPPPHSFLIPWRVFTLTIIYVGFIFQHADLQVLGCLVTAMVNSLPQ